MSPTNALPATFTQYTVFVVEVTSWHMEPGSLPRRLSRAWDRYRSFGLGVGASPVSTNLRACMHVHTVTPWDLDRRCPIWYLLATFKIKLRLNKIELFSSSFTLATCPRFYGLLCLAATILDRTDKEHFHHVRKFYGLTHPRLSRD